ncbi:SDR family oxidoreductase [Streptomyces sp. AC550_RSS872]|uniref:SDR family oxidoreductase n=1 Tax=Streptomyces sp. AC550_RSS872 TaxID=2823689 RepID=UPI001C252886|nr:SDR family oxidoreductase [Streptomyces sp. AC550_RSS872]
MKTGQGPGDLSGKVVLVTGGARGVGEAISRTFAARGAHVVVNYFHSRQEAPVLLESILAAGDSAELLRASVAVRAQVEDMFSQVETRHGGLDILVNNAGAGALGSVDEIDDRYWERAWTADLRGSLWCAQQAARLMDSRGGGAIVNVSSIGGGSLVMHGFSACGTAKAAVEALTRYLAVEYASRGIRVNTATCGVLESPVVDGFPEADRFKDRVREATPLGGRLGRAEEVAEVVAFLASPAASWVTGQNLLADGGLSLGAMLLAPGPDMGARAQTTPTAPAIQTALTASSAVPHEEADRARLLDQATHAALEQGPEAEDTTPAAEPLPAAASAPSKAPSPTAALALAPGIEPDPEAVIAIVGMAAVVPGANSPAELRRVLDGEHHVFGRPSRFDADAFYSPDPAAEDRSYTRESGFITGFVPHPALQAELERDTLPSREDTTLWLRHGLHTALDGVARSPADRFFAAFGFTADGSQELEEHLVRSGYQRLLADEAAEGDSGTLRAAQAEHYGRGGTPAAECLPHRIGRNAVSGILPDATEVVMVDTACSSSLYSIDLAVKALREGACSIAVSGGAFGYTARNVVLFSKLSGLSRSGEVRSFDRDASGVLFSDGAGVLVLKRLDRAETDGDRILGVVEGIGLSCDGKGKAIYAPNQEGQEIALRRAYADSPSGPESVSWVIAHATGTQAGDSTELAGLHRVAGQGPPALLSSNKAIVGHTGWAAGAVSVVQALTGLAHGTVSAQRYLRDPLPILDGSRFTPPMRPTALPGAKPHTVAVNAFGFGGTNAHLVIGQEATGRRSRTALHTDRTVVVGTSYDLPGDPNSGAVTAWLRGTGPAPERGFGDDYPSPGFAEVPIPPPTLRNMDRTQIMLLRAYHRLPDPVRGVCNRLHDTTGVIAGHMGPTRQAIHYALRCYLGDLENTIGSGPEFTRISKKARELVPPSTEDSFPGIMPNIISARLAALCDFHGLSMTIDTGPDAASDALRTAERHLRHGSLDLAVVAGVNGNSTPELAEALSASAELAEGAFLLVLARESTAREHGLPILAKLRTTTGRPDPSTRPSCRVPLADSGRSYLGADAMTAVFAHLAAPPGPTTIGSAADWGTQLHLDSSDAALPEPSTPALEQPRPKDAAAAPAPVWRMARRLAPAVPRSVREALAAVPEDSILLVPDRGLLDGVPLPGTTTVVQAPPPPAPGTPLPDPDSLAALLPTGERSHVRVVADLAATRTSPDDLTAVHRLRTLHDLAFLAAQRWHGGTGDSYGILLLDAVREGVVHPSAGPFTGLVKSLAREAPDAAAFSVLTEERDTERGLALLSEESGRHQDLSVSVHLGGERHAYTLGFAEPRAALQPSLGRDSVVVAVGGGRGITAELLTALAGETSGPRIYVLGRTPPSPTATVVSRADFLAAERTRRPQAGLAELITAHHRLRAAAETRRTIQRLTALCGSDRVTHLTCDVTDPAAVQAAMDSVHRAHDRIDLLINASGVHQGGLVRTASLEGVRRVRDTKILGYLSLHRALADRPPRRWHNIGSLLAVLGWPGEADYCSGNELLNCTSRWARSFSDVAETTLAMALWDESGFAAEPVMRDLLRRRAALSGVSNHDGVRLYLDELASHDPDPEVVHLGKPEYALVVPPALRKAADNSLSFRPNASGDDGHLRYHLLYGEPVAPAALIAALACEAVYTANPGRVVTALRDLSFRLPVRAEPPAGHQLRVGTDGTVRIVSALRSPGGRAVVRERLHATMTAELADRQPPAPSVVTPRPDGGLPVVPPWYREGSGPLFLSGPYASLDQVRVIARQATARFAPRLDTWEASFSRPGLPVLLLDAAIQLLFLLQEVDPGAPTPHTVRAAPVGIDRVELFTDRPDAALLATHGDAISLVADAESASADALAPDGTVLLCVTGLTVRPA